MYPYNETITGKVAFTLEITVLGLCELTVFNKFEIENIAGFAGFPINSRKSYNFTTSIETLIGVWDYCGNRTA